MPDPATPSGFRAARHALGLSQNAMAEALLVQSGRTIRKWESGERDIPGPAIVAVRLMLRGSTPATAGAAAAHRR